MKIIYWICGLIYLVYFVSVYLQDSDLETNFLLQFGIGVIIVYILFIPFIVKKISSKAYQDVGFYIIIILTSLVCLLTWLLDSIVILFLYLLLINLLTTPISLNLTKIYFCLVIGLVNFLIRFIMIYYQDNSYNFGKIQENINNQ